MNRPNGNRNAWPENATQRSALQYSPFTTTVPTSLTPAKPVDEKTDYEQNIKNSDYNDCGNPGRFYNSQQ